MGTSKRRSVFITGAASGIGAATARHFAAHGWFVGLYDINARGASELAHEMGSDSCTAGPLDVRDELSWAAAVASFERATCGRLDVLVNNAGLLAIGPLGETPTERLRNVIQVNLIGPILGIRACLPLLMATPGSRIVNVTSIAGLRALPDGAVYSSSKFGLRGLSDALRDELKPAGVSVSTIYPGFVATPMMSVGDGDVTTSLLERLDAVGFNLYAPQTVAEAILRAVERQSDEVGAGGQARLIRTLAAVCPPLLSVLWWFGEVKARRSARHMSAERSGRNP